MKEDSILSRILSMSLKRKILDQFSVLAFLVSMSAFLTQCAHQEVSQTLDAKLEVRGKSYTQELAAQSPFKKVKLSWTEASELMKERNPKYRQALIDKQTAEIRKGYTNNLTYEIRKSLAASIQTTLSPGEIAEAMRQPLASVPRQLESITDLKNISHSLNQTEWDRVTQSVQADASEREEIVNLHVLFCQSENLKNSESELTKIKELITKDPAANKNTEIRAELNKAQTTLKKEREQWLNQVRDFFNAEYFDVELNQYKPMLSFYREVTDPDFSDWKRWCILENSARLAAELKKQHNNDKPTIPGISLITNNLGITDIRANLADEPYLNENMANEVRQMIKNWHNLKSLQQKITNSELRFSQLRTQTLAQKSPTTSDLQLLTTLFDLKKKEIDQLKAFWLLDEKCWKV